MAYLLPFQSEEIKVITGQYISIASEGIGNTKVLIRKDTQLFPSPFVPLDIISEQSKTYGPYTEDKVIRIEPNGSNIEYSVGLTTSLKSSPVNTIEEYTPFSTVVAAATFITLTYEDDAGSVRLVSAGAHGLTAANSVNKYIYVTWSTGTAVSGFYKITALDLDTTGVKITIDLAYVLTTLGTPAVKVAGDTVVLATNTVNAYSTKAGSIINIEALYSCSSTTNAKSIIATYGGVTVITYAVPNSTISVLIDKKIFQISPTVISTNAIANVSSGASALANISDAVSVSASNDLVFSTIMAAADEPITLELYKIKIEY